MFFSCLFCCLFLFLKNRFSVISLFYFWKVLFGLSSVNRIKGKRFYYLSSSDEELLSWDLYFLRYFLSFFFFWLPNYHFYQFISLSQSHYSCKTIRLLVIISRSTKYIVSSMKIIKLLKRFYVLWYIFKIFFWNLFLYCTFLLSIFIYWLFWCKFTSHQNSPPNPTFFTNILAEINQSQILRKNGSMKGSFQNEGLNVFFWNDLQKTISSSFNLPEGE